MNPQSSTRLDWLIALSLIIAVLPASKACVAAEESNGDPVRVLLVTGVDYQGHKWQQTAPALAAALNKDPLLSVKVVETPDALAGEDIFDYDVIFIHFKNYDPPKDYEKVQANLTKFVGDGGGLVLFHFACGAFEDWPEFVKLAGRVWDKTKRGHDPHGSFTVNIDNTDHPITRPIKDFTITDELYTCLGGETSIDVIASAVSKVDGKKYPMGFVLTYGKGRVFHSPLGHDTTAVASPELQTMFRRACLWTAGRLE